MKPILLGEDYLPAEHQLAMQGTSADGKSLCKREVFVYMIQPGYIKLPLQLFGEALDTFKVDFLQLGGLVDQQGELVRVRVETMRRINLPELLFALLHQFCQQLASCLALCTCLTLL